MSDDEKIEELIRQKEQAPIALQAERRCWLLMYSDSSRALIWTSPEFFRRSRRVRLTATFSVSAPLFFRTSRHCRTAFVPSVC